MREVKKRRVMQYSSNKKAPLKGADSVVEKHPC